ncbi:histidine kinase [Actinokineospora fastidiosa]|uniref:histidine kinase n=1 Tax=Actinokineospora fastidiosa TaxID=1816 RepID=A0A918GQ77_9PSEU|nr:histidine kinase [Actinokineospora fastidiosa]
MAQVVPRPRTGAGLVRAVPDALERLADGLATAVLAVVGMAVLCLTAVLCLVGVGLPLVPVALRLVHVVADRERARLSRSGPPVLSPGPAPSRLADAVRSRATRRELAWLAVHAVGGLLLGASGLTIVLNIVRDGTFPLWWRLLPPDAATPSLGLWVVHDMADALVVGLLGFGWMAMALFLLPVLSRLQGMPGRKLLDVGTAADPALRIAHLTATRAAALDAHTAELRRIERALHDGTQNRVVAAIVLLGAARRALARGAEDTDVILGRAQETAEEALAQLRAVVRGVFPPVLADRGLTDALAELVADCPVPCVLDVDVGRCAASVEATIYFAIAEALTNITKHSGARSAYVTIRGEGGRVRVEVFDDGCGGANVDRGSGLNGIRRRIEAHDGTFTLASPPGGPTVLAMGLPCGL